MKRISILSIPFALSACATTQPPPRIVTQTVSVPVSVPCIRKSDLPEEPKPIGQLPPNASQAADLLAAQVLSYKAGWKEMLAVIGPCVKPTEVRTVQ